MGAEGEGLERAAREERARRGVGGAAGDRPGGGSGYEGLWGRIKAAGLGLCGLSLYDSSPAWGQGRLAHGSVG